MADEPRAHDEPVPASEKTLGDEVAPAPDKKEGETKPDAKPGGEETKPEGEPKDADEAEGETEGEESYAEEGDAEKAKRKRRPSRNERRIARLQAEVDALKEATKAGKSIDAPPAVTEAPPKPDDFKDYDDYLVAKAKHEFRQETRAEEDRRQKEARDRERQGAMRTFVEKRDALFDAGADAHEDFEAVFDDTVPVSPPMAQVLTETEHGHEVAYYLGKHRDEAARIAKLNPLAAARELGRIEAKIAAPGPAPKKSSAPTPPRTVGASARSSKSPGDMPYEEYVEARRSGKIK